MSDRNTPGLETLGRYLDASRDAAAWGSDGLSEEDAWRPMVESGAKLAAIVEYLAYVERWWLKTVLGHREVDRATGYLPPEPDGSV